MVVPLPGPITPTMVAPAAPSIAWFGLTDPYAWDGPTTAIEVSQGTATRLYGVVATSTSTVCVTDRQTGLYNLYMFGVPFGSAVKELADRPGDIALQQTPNVELADLPAPYPEQWNIAYLISTPGDATSPASDFKFELDAGNGGTSVLALNSTGIPSLTSPRWLGGDYAYALYKDVHVLDLGEGGWLMVLARYHRTDGAILGFGADGDESPSADNSSAAIVGYWCAEPTFTSEVKGPYFLVSRQHAIDKAGVATTVDLWLGVPAACEVYDDGQWWLYVYYTAESTEYDIDGTVASAVDGFQPGTFVRRILISDLPWGNAAGEAYADEWWGGPYVAATDEAGWSLGWTPSLVSGEALGKVNIWVATGAEWATWGDPAANGNRLLWDEYSALKDVDAVVVRTDDGLFLYVSANDTGERDLRYHAWGIWRATVAKVPAGRVYGTDFVARPQASAKDSGGTYDLVARSNPDHQNPYFDIDWWADGSKMRLDPDPVRVPSGEWIVFTGAAKEGETTPNFVLERYEATQANAERTYADAWP